MLFDYPFLLCDPSLRIVPQGGWVECSQEGTGLVEAETQSWMTGEQKTLVDVFSALNIAWLAILLVFYYLQSILAGLSLVIKVRLFFSDHGMWPIDALSRRGDWPRTSSSVSLMEVAARAFEMSHCVPIGRPWIVGGGGGGGR